MRSSPAPKLVRRVRSLAQRAVAALRRKVLFRYRLVLITLVVLAVGIGIGAVWGPTGWFPPSAVILTVLAGGLLLKRKSLAFLLAVVAAVLLFTAFALDFGQVGPGLLVTIGVTAVLAYLLSGVRERLGVQGLSGEKMLLELRDRLRAQGRLPDLPDGWGSKAVLQQAGGSSFGGDFVVSIRRGDQLDLAVVDVSGKGVDAGTRALLLSGAFGGLISAVPSGDFLAHCNDYLMRTAVGEGFVTAVHLSIDLVSGDYLIASAGHPPAVQFDSGAGTWTTTDAKGVVLGVIPEMSYTPVKGRLRPGDAIMLYTDGLIETPGEDLDAGVDRLLGVADHLVTKGFREGAHEVVDTLSRDKNDDCALVVIWRS
ncbi:PP2C family protein-serine/threonine phosphatase [Marinitenerispora sediminis]|uniref:Protein phosphatase n=1 Tax=Marinitenerispora sediminis TaxID=1931232 RepID=A0A368TA79_9ACTN|nr:PP2C family protein-serine/threonine phosphatase [Marinitenerispora sediminis]RCV53815.1 protein phosphatase [Marinitenerispora sediminis]RCV58215.1 protein phosphatase [Marinitenerispora sediminis]RCV61489.1 protein phosphatase [Marinitenerispora sediminis]